MRMIFCEICDIFKTTYFEEHLRTTAAIDSFYLLQKCMKLLIKLAATSLSAGEYLTTFWRNVLFSVILGSR